MATASAGGTVSAAAAAAAAASGTTGGGGEAGGQQHAWEDTGGRQTWENVREDAEGNIVVAASDSLTNAIRKRRKDLERQDYAQRHRRVVRDLIRYMYVVIDASRWTRVKDPVFPGAATRLHTIIHNLIDFVQEYYDQNPVSHLGFVLVKQGEAEILSGLSGNTKTHKLALLSVLESFATDSAGNAQAAGGEFSLQNGLEVSGRSLGHQPKHGSREIVLLTAALSTCDPGYIVMETLPKLLQANIRVSCLALSAEMYICRQITEQTNGTMGVCLDQQFLHDWTLAQCTPPPAILRNNDGDGGGCEMIEMGFPSRTSQDMAELVHAGRQKTLLTRTAFTCPQCQGKNSELPTDCAVCGLKLVLAPHLARSFHHLFPVPPFEEQPIVGRQQADGHNATMPTSSSSAMVIDRQLDNKVLVNSKDDDGCDMACYACLRPLAISDEEVLRLACPDCENLFCVDCDAFLHNSLHNCPGCLSQ